MKFQDYLNKGNLDDPLEWCMATILALDDGNERHEVMDQVEEFRDKHGYSVGVFRHGRYIRANEP